MIQDSTLDIHGISYCSLPFQQLGMLKYKKPMQTKHISRSLQQLQDSFKHTHTPPNTMATSFLTLMGKECVQTPLEIATPSPKRTECTRFQRVHESPEISLLLLVPFYYSNFLQTGLGMAIPFTN